MIYAATSCFLCSDFKHAGESTRQLAADIFSSFPLLRRYVDLSNTFMSCAPAERMCTLRPPPPAMPKNSEEESAEVFRRGRLRTVLLTALFGFCYFLVVNADTIAALVSTAEDEAHGEGETVVEAPSTLPPEQSSTQ
jgi:hypothetical protein